MCVFHVESLVSSFSDFLAVNPQLPVYQQHEKGEKSTEEVGGIPYEEFSFSCEVSDRDWDDVEGQVIDIISFLEVYTPYLQKLKETHQIADWRFDLPYECLLGETQFTQINFLPPKLLQLMGALEIGLEMSLYWPSEDVVV